MNFDTIKRGEILENKEGQFIFVCCICNATNLGLKEVESHLKTHVKLIKEEKIHDEDEEEIDSNSYDDKAFMECIEVIDKISRPILTTSSPANTNVVYPQIKVDCNYCSKRFPCSGLRNQHIASIHLGEPSPYNCSNCNVNFPNEIVYLKHMRFHKLPDTIDCPICGYLFNSLDTLIRHINGKDVVHIPAVLTPVQPVHNNRTTLPKSEYTCKFQKYSSYQCDTCGRNYKSRYHIRLHLYTHLEEKPFQCNICGRGFAHPTNLKTHVLRHNGIKPFQCNYCPKAFSTTTELKIHIRSHTGEKGHICSYCGKRFSTASRRLCHTRRSHTKERRHKCYYEGCDEAYFTPRDLKVHIRNHTGERPIVCEMCDTTFANPKVYRVHMQLHNPEKSFQCKFCPSKFSQSSGRRGHEVRVHGAT